MVVFQENAWADENVTKQWIRQCWKPVAIRNNAPKLLVMDVHRAQTVNKGCSRYAETGMQYGCHLCTVKPP